MLTRARSLYRPLLRTCRQYSQQHSIEDTKVSGIRHLNDNIFKIALTGGPCAGKSSALSYMSMRLMQHGFKVFTVPEAATIVFSNGAEFTTLTPGNLFMSI
jgi:putative protein kinase ArgK-like GTPase of G3E family